jgi:hypothetical protein
LSPEAKQIYIIPRQDHGATKWITQTSIDGYRVIADRTRRYAGSDDAVFVMRADGKTPERATTTVYKMVEGQRCPFTASAYWDEYNAGQNLWNRMPRVMLAKCSEALALRKAFPAELSGLYTDAEMDQAGVVDARSAVAVAESPRPIRVDHSTGEIAATSQPMREAPPMTEAGDQPCAIDGCSATCAEAFVGFSIRKYGHPLCAKHSAMAKRGELDGALARLNEPTVELSQPSVIEATATSKKTPLDEAKATLWTEAKAKGLTKDLLDDYAQETMGEAPADMSLAGIVQLTQKLKRENRDDLLDRLTNQPAVVIDAGGDMFPDVEFAAGDDRYTR